MIPALQIAPAKVLELLQESGQSFEISRAADQNFSAAKDPRPLHWDSREISNETPSLYFGKAGKRFNPAFKCNEMLANGHFVIAAAADLKHAYSEQHIATMLDSGRMILATDVQGLLYAASLVALPVHATALQSIGITGTNGKTSCTAITADLIKAVTGQPVARIGTLGFFDGHEMHEHAFPTTPDFGTFCRCLSLLAAKNVRYLAMEVSSHSLEERRLGNWKFDVAVLTNITPDHLDFHKSMENYRRAKIKLFTNHLRSAQGQAIVCASRSPWREVIHSSKHVQKCTVVFDSQHTNEIGAFKQNAKKVQAEGTRLEAHTLNCLEESVGFIRFELSQIEPAGTGKEVVEAPLIGRFQMENIGASILAAHALGLPIADLVAAAKKLNGVPGRLQRVPASANEPNVFIDYAHSADSLEQAIFSLRALAKKQTDSQARIFTVFGCGGDRDRLKRPAMGRIATALSDQVFVTSDNPRTEDPAKIVTDILNGVEEDRKQRVTVELDRARAIEAAVCQALPDDIILIAGKGHENYQIIQHEKHPFSDFEIARNVLATTYRK